jgi:hypothetical protein
MTDFRPADLDNCANFLDDLAVFQPFRSTNFELFVRQSNISYLYGNHPGGRNHHERCETRQYARHLHSRIERFPD